MVVRERTLFLYSNDALTRVEDRWRVYRFRHLKKRFPIPRLTTVPFSRASCARPPLLSGTTELPSA